MSVYLIVQLLYLSLIVNYLVIKKQIARLVLLDTLINFAILVGLHVLDLLFQPLSLLVLQFDHRLDLRLCVALQFALVVDDVCS